MNWGWTRIIMTGICYFLPYWRHAFIGISLICFPGVFVVLFLLPESPKWLEAKGKWLELNKSLHWIAQFNGEKGKKKSLAEEPFLSKESSASSVDSKSLNTVRDLFASKTISIETLTLMTMWFAVR